MTVLGKRRAATMGECAKAIVCENEEQWAKWKENKCVNFEKPSSKICEGRKRDEKKAAKLADLGGPLVKPRQGEMNDSRNGRGMIKYLRYPKEQLDANGNSVELKPALAPAFTDFLYPYLCD